MTNHTSVRYFVLMGFSDDWNLQILHAVVFLFVYLITLMGNCFILMAVAFDQHLHSPMYFFLANLSLVDICSICTTVPKSIVISLTNNKEISFGGCVTQVFFMVTFVGSELTLLTTMAYDRYVAICNPLQYKIIMNWNACIQMAVANWICNLIHAVLETGITFRLNFCNSNMIGQYFCDIPQLQKISCTDIKVNQILILVLGFFFDSFCFALIFASYGYIFSTIIKMPLVQSRHKVFSTCTPHLTVFSVFIVTAVFSYMRPKSLSSSTVDLLSAIFYTILPPILNPIIYSLRNKDIQNAVLKLLQNVIYCMN
ncbi:olfactory receptor 14C36-like [Thamnophis elegans]|uniref:olfactory receptor 14C36-like n=1 Tax=Thamnophis elegans TaxID=35005 RepID=UPI0013765FC7|nr:olfactory receptor 14C36-like [Thamnophis elegans]